MNISERGRNRDGRKRVAVIGSGISGASAAWALSAAHEVILFEAEGRAGGHTATVEIDYDGTNVVVDTGFIVYNELNYPNLAALFAHLNVPTHPSNMSFALSLDGGRREWSANGWAGLFAQRRNALSPAFHRMLLEIMRFNSICILDRDAGRLEGLTVGDYLIRRGFSERFRDDYLIPMAAAIWSTPHVRMLDFPAATLVTFFDNHRLLHFERPQWRTVTGGARTYLERLIAPLGAKLRLGDPVRSVIRDAFGVSIWTESGHAERFDEVVIATHSDQALAILGDASAAERTILSAITYRPNRVVLHRDARLMPKRRRAWASWNYLRSSRSGASEVSVTYWMNRLQGIEIRMPLFVSLNPVVEPREELVFGEWSFAHPQFDAAAIAAQARLSEIQNLRRTRFAGAWTGYGFHEDGLRSGIEAAEALGVALPWRPWHGQSAPIIAAR
jgi:predicted NAD/FAD-binding protein